VRAGVAWRHGGEMADRAKPILLGGRAVVDDLGPNLPPILACPLPKSFGEFPVRDHEGAVEADRLEALEGVIEHRAPCYLEQILRPVTGPRVPAGGGRR